MRIANFAVAILLCALVACDGGGPQGGLVGPGGTGTVATVDVEPASARLTVGGTAVLTAVPKDPNGNALSDDDVSWTSSAPAVATVSATGVVTAVGAGSAAVTATKGGKKGTASILVDGPDAPKIASVLVTPAVDTINALAHVRQFRASAKDSSGADVPNATFVWTSSNTAVATVAADGKVTAKSVGTALIVAVAAGGITDTASVTVRQVPASVALSPASLTLPIGGSAPLHATVKDSGGATIPNSPVTWVSSAPSIASVSTAGVVTGVAEGTAMITAASGPASKQAAVDVTAAPPPPPPGRRGIWIGPEEIAALPTSGPAWANVKGAADEDCGTPDLENQDDPANVCIMAKALVFARTGQTAYRDAVVAAIRSIVNSGTYGGRALALGRELAAYPISADLIGLATHDPTLDQQFREKLIELRTTYTSDGPQHLIACQERRPNNWGTACGTSRIAVDAYLGDTADLARAARVFRGYLGDRSAYASFIYGEDLSWQADPDKPVGINPVGATKDGHSIDGVLPDDQRRSGSFTWPPPKENYVYTGLEGALATAILLHRQGYDVFNWSDRALLRAYVWVHQEADFPAVGNDTWQPHAVNHYYGTNFPAPSPARAGKNVGWTDWTHPPR